MSKNVTEWLDETASRLPDKIAFSDGEMSLSFDQLRKESRSCATELAKRGLFKQPVVIAMERSPHTVSAFMGAAYSGNFYAPIDIEMPAARIRRIIEKLRPAAYIAAPEYINLLRESGADESMIIPFPEVADAETDDKLLEKASGRQIDTDILYVLFTSGSTGEPKGVCISHRNVIDYSNAVTSTFGLDENTILGQTASFTFDLSVLYIYQPLQNGCTNYIIPKICYSFSVKMIEFLNKYKINTIYWVPTSYNIIAKSGILDVSVPKHLRRLWFVGEVMQNSVLNIWRRALPDAQYVNLFGPTEITDTFLYYIINRDFDDGEPLPIGKPHKNVDVLILNEQNQLCRDGETGELCVRGIKISPGYYNDPERTEKVFQQNPLHNDYREIIYRTGDFGYINEYGEIMFAGRRDAQIKHLGYRIELGEVETAASAVDGVDMCACVYDYDKKNISLFYTGTADEKYVAKELELKIQRYMLPGFVKKLEALPRNANGKIDRLALKNELM
jgi:amino acid adenylation domain-containing protein